MCPPHDIGGVISLDVFISYFSGRKGLDIHAAVSEETICMKCQSLFSGKKYVKMPSTENFTQHA